MQVIWKKQARKDLEYWHKRKPKIANLIHKLIEDIVSGKNHCRGRQEVLKYNLAGYCSKRIDIEHRLVYNIFKEDGVKYLVIVRCKGHYEDH